jgi:hypothetical protein
MAVEVEAQKGAATGVGAAPRLSWINWLNLAAYVINVVIIYVSITGVFGATNREVSMKYQTLVTPASFAFSIWGPIYIWEGVFVVAQMLPRFRNRPVVRTIAPFWWSACICQVVWSLLFAQEWLTASLVFMVAILGSLLGLLQRANSVDSESFAEFWLLRAPFSLHAGWIIAACAVSANVQADYAKASPAELLAVAVVSLAVVFAVASVSAIGAPRPDAIIPLVAAWALFAVSSELNAATRLLDPTKHNPVVWPRMVLEAVRTSASVLSLACLGLAAAGAATRVYRSGIVTSCARPPSGEEETSVVPPEATPSV